jgi:hypothetical protein
MAEKVQQGFNSWLRKSSRQTNPGLLVRCPLCSREIAGATEVTFGKHVRTDHADAKEGGNDGARDAKVRELWELAKAEALKSSPPTSGRSRCVLPSSSSSSSTLSPPFAQLL